MPATPLKLPASIQARPPSARLVYLALRDSDGSLTASHLADETGVSVDRVRRLLGDLNDAGLVRADSHPGDNRQKLWTATEVPR
jgi:DNA-binding transcriptional regulator GbsR (MarR family)